MEFSLDRPRNVRFAVARRSRARDHHSNRCSNKQSRMPAFLPLLPKRCGPETKSIQARKIDSSFAPCGRDPGRCGQIRLVTNRESSLTLRFGTASHHGRQGRQIFLRVNEWADLSRRTSNSQRKLLVRWRRGCDKGARATVHFRELYLRLLACTLDGASSSGGFGGIEVPFLLQG
jgi:hypothetical protein